MRCRRWGDAGLTHTGLNGASVLSSFRSPPFRWLWSSSLAAFFGAGMQTTATAWLALDSAGGAFAVGLVLAARMLPNLLFGLAAGTLADRAHRGRQLGLLQQT